MRIVRSDIRASKTGSLRVERCQPGAKNHLSDAECIANLLRVDCGDAAALLAGQLVHQHAQRQLAGEPKPECSARWFESLPAAPSITNANVLRLGAIYPRFDGRRVASGASTPSHHRPSLNVAVMEWP